MNLKFAVLIVLSLFAAILISGCVQKEKKIIEITSTGFRPDTLTINAGETVTFVNKDTAPHWPASDPHPGHFMYPETGGCIASKFDACRDLSQDETFSFKFDIKGTWKYHDHRNANLTGTIIVQ